MLEEIFGAYKINLLNEVEINEAEIIAFGDAHANPMQVIYQMLHTGIGYMPPDKLRRLAEIYARIDQETSISFTREVTEEESQEVAMSELIKLDEIREACELIHKYFEYTGGSKTFVHLGDVFGDRGACDEIMLALLKEIKAQAEQAGGEFVILASNHGTFLEDIGYEELDFDFYNQTRSARVGITCNRNYIRDLGRFLVENTQLFYFDRRTNTFFTHCPITREDLGKFVDQANKVIADPTKYGLDPSQFNFGPLEIPQNDDPEKISQFVERANQYYTAVMSWFFDFEDLSQSPDFKDFNKKRDLLQVESLTAVVGTRIRLRNQGDNPAKPFNVTMVHGHDDEGKYNEVRDVYNLNNYAGQLSAYRDVGYERHKRSEQNLYIYTNNAKSAKIHQN